MGHRKPFQSVIEAWLQWDVVTGLCLALALALLPAIVQPELLVLPLQVSLLVAAAVCGVLIGLAQAVLLHLPIPSLARWLAASGTGLAAAAFLMGLLFQFTRLDGIVGAILAGTVVGSLQSFFLSWPLGRRAWIVSTVLGWTAAGVVAVLFMVSRGIAPANAPFDLLRAIAAGWVLLALVLLFALLLLFPTQEERKFGERVRWL